MSVASVLYPSRLNQKTIQSNTLLEELYTYYSLSQLQLMLKCEPDKTLLQSWNVSAEKLMADIKVAIEFVKND